MLAEDARHADQLEAEIRFFMGDAFEVLHFVEWETLPWDGFSPHQDIISQRLSVLSRLPELSRGVSPPELSSGVSPGAVAGLGLEEVIRGILTTVLQCGH